VSRTYTPSDTTANAYSFVTGINTSEVFDTPVSGFPVKGVGSVTLTITWATSVEGETDGIGESATSTARIRYFDGTSIVTLAGSQVTGSANGVGDSYGLTSASGTTVIELPPMRLSQVLVQAYSYADVNGSATAAEASAVISSWSVVARFSQGTIGA